MTSLKITVLFLFISFGLFAQQYIGDNKLVLEGSADLILESDRASFDFTVVGFGSLLRDAVNDARTKVNNAAQILQKYGIPKNNISTSAFESGQNTGGKAFLSSSKDFKTFMNVSVIIDELPSLENIIIALSESGIESISRINYSLNDFSEYKLQAREKAIEDAKMKAEQISNKFNVVLKKVIYIEEAGFYQSYPNPFNPSTDVTGIKTATTISFYAKPVKVSQRLKVVYEIE